MAIDRLTASSMPPTKSRPINRGHRGRFPFLELPPELRHIVYDLVLGYDGVDNYYKRWITRDAGHRRLTDAGSRSSKLPKPPSPRLRTPGILLANRQISAEAEAILHRKPLVLSHGSYRRRITQAITADSLRKVRWLIITDDGFGTAGDLVPEMLEGHLSFIQSITDVLKTGHAIDRMEIRLRGYITLFGLQSSFSWDWETAMEAWYRVPMVGELILDGYMAPHLVDGLRRELSSKPFPFLSLPRDIRDIIYDILLEWGDVASTIHRLAGLPFCDWAEETNWHSPGILAANHQIHQEAREVLRNKEMVWDLEDCHREEVFPSMSFCVRGQTFAQVRFFHLKITGRLWVGLLSDLWVVLPTVHALRKIVVTLHDPDREAVLAKDGFYPDEDLAVNFADLSSLRGIREVVINSLLPTCFTDQVIAAMKAPLGVPSATFRPWFAQARDGTVRELPAWTSDDDPRGGQAEIWSTDLDSIGARTRFRHEVEREAEERRSHGEAA